MILKLRSESLKANDANSSTIRIFKADLRKALTDRFNLDAAETAIHPFTVASVLDPATKSLPFFADDFKTKAYTNVRALLSAGQQPAANHSVTAVQPAVSQPATLTSAEKKVKLDTRAATLSFLGLASAAEQAPAISEFDRYIATPVSADVDALQRWSGGWHDNEKHFPTVACLAKKYLSMPSYFA